MSNEDGTTTVAMVWKGRELVTVGDLGAAVVACETRAEAEAFMAAYRATTPHADANIGYLSGYHGRDDMARIQDWCGVAHPILGRAEVTPAQVAAAGRAVVAGAGTADVRAMLDPSTA